MAADTATLKKRRGIAKGQFTRIYNKFLKDSQRDVVEIDSLKHIIEDMEKSFCEFEIKQAELLIILDDKDEDDKTTIVALEKDIESMYDDLCSARDVLTKMVKKEDTIAYSNKKDRKTILTSKSDSLKVKKLDVPSFSGEIRKFPTFKMDYKLHMIPSFGKDPFALRSCLHGPALESIQGIYDDYDEMMNRLEMKYGCPSKLVDSIINDVRKLKKVNDDDHVKLLKMIETIERAWQDLKGMNLENEMDTTLMISQIEKLLPSVQKREWTLIRQGLLRAKKSCTFLNLLEFLRAEREAIEYMNEELRAENNKPRKTEDSKMVSLTEGKDEEANKSSEVQSLREMIEGLVQVVKGSYNASSGNSRVTSSNPTQNYGSSKCWYHSVDSHETNECYAFNAMDVPARLEAARKNFACFLCLKKGHISRHCQTSQRCTVLIDGNACGGRHHEKFHSIERTANHGDAKIHSSKRQSALLMVSEVCSESGPLTVLWDSGANVSLLTHSAAHRLGLKGKEVSLRITKVGNQVETMNTKEYSLPLIDNKGNIWKISLYGIKDITGEQPDVDTDQICDIFGIDKNLMKARPKGKVEALIGTDWCRLLPQKIDERDNLQLMQNMFGYCVRGHHPMIAMTPSQSNHVQIHLLRHLQVDRGDVCVLKASRLSDDIEKFLDIDSLGVQTKPKCGGCKCGTCSLGNRNCTLKEERELQLIKEGLTLDKDQKRWTVSYPWIKSPYLLPNNYHYALARMRAVERRLSKKGHEYVQMYNAGLQDMIDRGAARALTNEELEIEHDYVYYLPHHEVFKPSSSTPVRIVFDASAQFMGGCINDYWAKGPNIIGNLLSVILRFRQFKVALVADIKKMYNSVRLSKKDQHTHRFLWRWMKTDKGTVQFILLTVTFGDRPGGTIASLALKMTAEMNINEYPVGAYAILRNMYVDDFLKSVETYEQAKRVIKEVDKILEKGGFAMKSWLISGDTSKMTTEMEDINFVDSNSEKVLGMSWSPKVDILKFNVKWTLCGETKYKYIPDIVTPRMMLSQIARIYDPLGLLAPFVIEGKTLMRKSLDLEDSRNGKVEGEAKWDRQLHDNLCMEWDKFCGVLHQLEEVEFTRCLKPEDAIGNPELIVFTDASETAYGTCAYVRWNCRDGVFKSSLIMAKNKLAPKRKLSIPRLELCAAVMGSRLERFLVEEMEFQFQRLICMTDSMIVRFQIQKESYGFKTFTATRIGEIQENSEPSRWFWVASGANPADMTTRITELSESTLKLWKEGPEFLKQPIEQWPISTTSYVETKDLPDRCMVHLTEMDQEAMFVEESEINLGIIDTKRYSSYDKMVKVTTIVLGIARVRSFKVGNIINDGECYRVAEEELIKFAQRQLNNWSVRFRRLGPWKNKDGLIVVGDRLEEWFKMPWNQSELVLLPADSHFTYLYVLKIHNEDHRVSSTVARVRRRFWIPQLTKIVRRIRRACVTCRKLDDKTVQQKMGSLPLDRMTPSPPFYITYLDFFGPMQIRDTVKGRSRGKAYGVIFNCGVSRGVYIDVADSYDTDGFLLVLRRFITIHGYPYKFRADHGSQIVAGSKEISEIMRGWDWSRISSFGVTHGSSWEFTKSADAPWENGCSESLIRLTKRNIAHSIGPNILTITELQTVMFEIANLLNERPIGVEAEVSANSYICPNELLMGRASKDVPVGDFDLQTNTLKRLHTCQQVVQAFWKNWMQKYFHTLIVRQRWHTDTRNLREGDIVIIQDCKQTRGKWKMGVVQKAIAGKDGKVRDVEVGYKIVKPDDKYEGAPYMIVRRSVHRLVLLLPVEEQGK